MSKELIDQTPKNAVAVFEDHGIQVFIYPKKDESVDDAITRVADKHNINVKDVKRL